MTPVLAAAAKSIKNAAGRSMISLALSFFSGILLIFAFPQTDIWPLAWVGLIPLFYALDGKKPFSAFGAGYLCGIVFFSGTLYWLGHVTVIGTVVLIFYLSLYFGLFGILYSYFVDFPFTTKSILLPSSWVALEYLRAHLFSGFGWVSLGHSQYKFLPLIQIADVTGVGGVSFLLVLSNLILKEQVGRRHILNPNFASDTNYREYSQNKRMHAKGGFNPDKRGQISARFDQSALRADFAIAKSGLRVTWAFIFIVFVVLSYGYFCLSQPYGAKTINAAVVQGNVPQHLKWDEPLWPKTFDEHITLTKEAAQAHADLVVWPETSLPGILEEDVQYPAALSDFIKSIQIPLLYGVVTKEDHYYNAAVLLSKDGDVLDKYRKIHLVPFGEFVPFRKELPFLASLVQVEDFSPGRKYTLFSLAQNKFAVLICFEDTLANLVREFVRQGAQLLVNITNDAWFMDTKEPFIHLQSAVFSAVENKRDLIRAANTGVSCFIDRYGRVTKYLEDSRGKKTFTPGMALHEVHFYDGLTFYTKFGDFFTYLCFLCILLAIFKKGRTRPV